MRRGSSLGICGMIIPPMIIPPRPVGLRVCRQFAAPLRSACTPPRLPGHGAASLCLMCRGRVLPRQIGSDRVVGGRASRRQRRPCACRQCRPANRGTPTRAFSTAFLTSRPIGRTGSIWLTATILSQSVTKNVRFSADVSSRFRRSVRRCCSLLSSVVKRCCSLLRSVVKRCCFSFSSLERSRWAAAFRDVFAIATPAIITETTDRRSKGP